MSYCRMGPKSDVYMYASIGGGYVIHLGSECYTAGTPEEVVTVLQSLRDAGKKVPQSAFDRLYKEMSYADPEDCTSESVDVNEDQQDNR